MIFSFVALITFKNLVSYIYLWPPPQESEMETEEEDVEETPSRETTAETQVVVDVPFTITNEIPEDSKPVDEQLSLF